MCELVSKEKATSLVWNYFGLEADKDGKPINAEKAICRIASGCGKKPVLAKGGNTSNLLTHLRRHHPKHYAKLLQAQEKKKSKEKNLKASEGQAKLKAVDQSAAKYGRGSKKWQELTRGEAIMLVKLSIILFSNSHNFTYYAHRFYLLFSKLCLVKCSWHFIKLTIYY